MMKVFCVLLLLVPFSVGEIVHDCDGNDNGKTFVPWKEYALSMDDCYSNSAGKQPGTCTSEERCKAGEQGTPHAYPDSNINCKTIVPGQTIPSATCCTIKNNCTASPVLQSGGATLEGACMLPRFCTNSASGRADTRQCGGLSDYSCCVEQEPQSSGIKCSTRYSSIFRRLSAVNLNLDYDEVFISSERFTNFLPFAMLTFDRLREKDRCAPLGDCAAASYIAVFYHLLRDFTDFKKASPDTVLTQILNTVPGTTRKLIEDELKKTSIKGHITPEAMGKLLDILWSDTDLNLMQYNSGTCADWIRMARAIRGDFTTWKCDNKWFALTAAQYCRPTYETNLGECASGAGVCFMDGEESGVCERVGLRELPNNHDCRNGYADMRAFCCQKAVTTGTKMTFKHNIYRNVHIAIDPSVSENASVISQIKKSFTDASHMLYEATGQRAVFGSIRVILPRTWTSSLANERRTDEKLSNAEFIVKRDVDLENDGLKSNTVTMHTLQLGYCGSRGLGTYLTPRDLRSDLGPANIVKHFAFNRYGIFKEFPRNEQEMAPFDALMDPPPRCAKDDSTSYVYCNDTFDIVVESNSKATASLAWLPDYTSYANVKHIVHFCDSRECDTSTHHNKDIDNTHNRLCNKRPTLDVIVANDDFYGAGTPPRPGIDATPNFVVVHDEFDDGTVADKSIKTRIVLVLDRSTTMTIDNRFGNMQAAAGQFVDMTDPSFEVAVLSFAKSTKEESGGFVKCDNDGKDDLKSAIFAIKPGGIKCIQSGLLDALELLADSGEKGGQIILMTDNEANTCYDYNEYLPDIMEQGAIVHTVAITAGDNTDISQLSKETGGLAYFIADGTDVLGFVLQMQSVLIQASPDDVLQRVTIVNEVALVQGEANTDVRIYLDSGLGTDTMVATFYNKARLVSMSGTLIPPVGASGVSQVQCVDENQYAQLTCRLNTKPVAGYWTLKMKASEPHATDVNVAATATIDTRSSSTFTITGFIAKPEILTNQPKYFWEKETLLDKSQAFIATVAYGRMAVLGARVTAVITHESGESWRQVLSDNGEGYNDFQGADLYEFDGIYSALFSQFTKTGRYGVTLEVVAEEGKAFYTPDVVIGNPKSLTYLVQTSNFRVYVSFTRILSIGMFEVIDSQKDDDNTRRKRDTADDSSATINTPGRVTKLNLLLTTTNDREAEFTFTWTAVGSQGMVGGYPSYYLLNASTNLLEVQGRGDEIEISSLVDSRLVSYVNITDQDSHAVPGSPMMRSISLPVAQWKPGTIVYFSVTAYNSESNYGATSNIITAKIASAEKGTCSSNGIGDCDSSSVATAANHYINSSHR